MQPFTFYDRFFRQLPIVFPLIAGFHFVLLGYSIFTFAQAGVLDSAICYGSCAMLLLYALLWVAVCDRRRWAAVGYMTLTAVNLMLYFFARKDSIWHQISDVLLPFDVLMCVFLIFYYKRFR